MNDHRAAYKPVLLPSLTEAVNADPKTALQYLVCRFQPALETDAMLWRSYLSTAITEAYAKGQVDILAHYSEEFIRVRDNLVSQRIDAEVKARDAENELTVAKQRLAVLEVVPWRTRILVYFKSFWPVKLSRG